MGIQAQSALWFLYFYSIGQFTLLIKLFEINDDFSLVFDLEKILIIMSPWAAPMFLFLLEHIPAGACGCASGSHEVRMITDIDLSSHHFLPGDLSSSTGWSNTPTRILVLLREHGWSDSHLRIILFSQQHLIHNGEITWSHTLSSGMTESPCSPAGLSPWGQAHHILRTRQSPFCRGLVYLLEK